MSEIWALQFWFWINYGNKERERERERELLLGCYLGLMG
jgi:hypothetical protein